VDELHAVPGCFQSAAAGAQVKRLEPWSIGASGQTSWSGLIAFARLLIRVESYPRLIRQATTNPSLLEGGMVLMSTDSVSGAIYLLPAVSATSPAQLGVVVHRGSRGIVLLFPEPIRSPEDRHALNLADLHTTELLVAQPRALGRPLPWRS
jgi:hypothetical protein